MTPALITTIVALALAVAAMLYAMQVSIENERLRAARAYYLELINDLIEGDE